MIKKSFSLMAILGIFATASFAQGPAAEDVEKATRFHAVESEGEQATAPAASEETSPAPPVDEENSFDRSKGVDPLEMLGGSAQLEDLGRLPRICWACRWGCC